MKKYNILLDISPAFAGYTGIAHDSRLMYAALSSNNNIKLEALAYPLYHHNGSIKWSEDTTFDEYASLKIILNNIKSNPNKFKFLFKSFLSISNLRKLFLKNAVQIRNININPYADLLWRNIFSKSLDHKYSKHLLDNFILNISDSDLYLLKQKLLLLNQSMYLNTSKYDFVVFQNSLNIRVSKHTKKIIRYHDSIPIFAFDQNETNTNIHYKLLKNSIEDEVIYACNSDITANELKKLFPKFEKNIYTIPCAIDSSKSKVVVNKTLDIASILISKISEKTINKDTKRKVVEQIKSEGEDIKFLFFIGTIEPRKNLQNLIEAWHYLYLKYKIRLVICGSEGWLCDDIIEKIKTYTTEGGVIHLENISNEELPYLYNKASCFTFLSFNEGFGLPLLDAMFYGCPIVASDIKIHKWVLEKAALFADPYNILDIIKQIELLLFSKNSSKIRKETVYYGSKRVRYFYHENIGKLWQQLFDKIK